jgi:hypothetical protein
VRRFSSGTATIASGIDVKVAIGVGVGVAVEVEVGIEVLVGEGGIAVGGSRICGDSIRVGVEISKARVAEGV